MLYDFIALAEPIAFAVLAGSVILGLYWIYQNTVRRPVEMFAVAFRAILRGDLPTARQIFERAELEPLVKNIDEAMRRGEENRTVLPFPNAWTSSRLKNQLLQQFGNSRLCIVANREPCIHNYKEGKVETVFPASGLVTAVEPIVRACEGLWIAHGSGSADRDTADRQGRLQVPPHDPKYSLKRVWLTPEEEAGYYYGFSNEGLWPLCHVAHTRPTFRRQDWETYRQVNEKFAEAFHEELKESPATPIALIQDYHFALLPQMIRKKLPQSVLSLFWHIPWPNPEVIGICPWKKEIVEGMISADLIGFHTQYHCNNFLDTADRFLEVRVDRENFSITAKGHVCYVKPFPISIEWPPRHNLSPGEIPGVRRQIIDENNLPKDALIAVGVDRLDYTKGILEKFLAVERLLEQHPGLIGRFVLVQISAPSRTSIGSYRDLNEETQDVAKRINARFGREGYRPIVHRLKHHDSQEVVRYYRAADVCVVSSLHDGMNLVAKEFVASRPDNGGALVLSSFTGAAREMVDAFITNPYDIEESAEMIYRALTLAPAEREQRMSRMRAHILKNNAYCWAGHFLEEIHRIAEAREVPWVNSITP